MSMRRDHAPYLWCDSSYLCWIGILQNRQGNEMSNKRKAQFSSPDQKQAKKQIDSLVQGGMNYVAATIAKKINEILAELDSTEVKPADAEGFKRGLVTAKALAEVHIQPNS